MDIKIVFLSIKKIHEMCPCHHT